MLCVSAASSETADLINLHWQAKMGQNREIKRVTFLQNVLLYYILL